jgi:hypothetical protein
MSHRCSPLLETCCTLHLACCGSLVVGRAVCYRTRHRVSMLQIPLRGVCEFVAMRRWLKGVRSAELECFEETPTWEGECAPRTAGWVRRHQCRIIETRSRGRVGFASAVVVGIAGSASTAAAPSEVQDYVLRLTMRRKNSNAGPREKRSVDKL